MATNIAILGISNDKQSKQNELKKFEIKFKSQAPPAATKKKKSG